MRHVRPLLSEDTEKEAAEEFAQCGYQPAERDLVFLVVVEPAMGDSVPRLHESPNPRRNVLLQYAVRREQVPHAVLQ